MRSMLGRVMLSQARARAGVAMTAGIGGSTARFAGARVGGGFSFGYSRSFSIAAGRATMATAWRFLLQIKTKSSIAIPLPEVAQTVVRNQGIDASKFGTLVTPGYEKKIGVWLVGCCGMLYSMIFIGGYTRLSGSGLSMTDWRIQGRSLPRNEEAWVREFEEYKKYPEYQRLHAGTMELSEFKRIYFVEWFHRMWGRAAGVFFAAPMVYYAAKGVFRATLGIRLVSLLGLGVSQAFVGWWMVRSGMEAPEKHTPLQGQNQRPRVSPYRLASHWTAALTLYCGCVWSALDMLRPSPQAIHGASVEAVKAAGRLRFVAFPTAAIVGLTLLSGPFVAGNDAGHAYNTWPKMIDDWVPPEWLESASNPFSKWRMFFEDTAVVQFDHRCLAYASVISTLGVYAYSLCLPVTPAVATAVRLLPAVVSAQMFLGIATLMLYVPLELGVAHQAGGVAVLTTLLLLLHTLRVPPIMNFRVFNCASPSSGIAFPQIW